MDIGLSLRMIIYILLQSARIYFFFLQWPDEMRKNKRDHHRE